MNNYITLDNKKYLTPAQAWQPLTTKPSTIRYTLSGATDVTYGPAVPKEWQGEILAPVTAGSGWGTVSDLRATLAKRTALSFTDHYGTNYTVHAVGQFPEDSKSPMWDGASNEFKIAVRLVKA